MKSRHIALLDKSLQAALSAIELYNKPNFTYREESFSILMVNAWELLLKAKRIKDNGGKIISLYIKETIKKKNGEKSKKFKYTRNRTENFQTLGIQELIKNEISDKNLKEQLETLIQIRDNSVHFMNSTKLFEKEFLGIAISSLKSYEIMIKEWFNKTISEYNLSLIPLTFNVPEIFNVENLKKAPESHKKLLEYISSQKLKGEENSEHAISINIDLKYKRSSKADITFSFDKDGTPIFYDSEEDFKKKFPFDWSTLQEKLKSRYTNIKFNQSFWNLKKYFELNEKLMGKRYLNPIKKTGTSQKFYSTNILQEFDKHYNKV